MEAPCWQWRSRHGEDKGESSVTGLLLRVEQMLEYLSPAERRIAEYILKNSGSIVGQPVAALAEHSGSNKATVIRFCKAVGCNGYRDFTFQLAAELAISRSEYDSKYTDINIGDSADTILKNVCLNSVKAIEESYSLLKSREIEKAVELLIRAPRIDFYGIGASWIVAQDAQYKFMRINKNCTAYADPHLQMTSASNLSEKDAAVAISWSGETRDVIDAARQAKENGATVIAITKCGKNHLSEFADVVFSLVSPETSIRCSAMSSRIAQMTMIDILFSCMVSMDYQRVRPCLERTRPIGPSKRLDQDF